jgi:hypothetical protein
MTSVGLVPGEVVYVVYGDDPYCVHARLLTGHVRGSSWVVVSPMFDFFEEDISLENPDLVVVSMGRAPGLPPFEVRPEQLFDFNPVLVPVQITVLVAVGGRLAGRENGVDTHLRWLPSGCNPADAPSRGFVDHGEPGDGRAMGDGVGVGLGPSRALDVEGVEGPPFLLYASPPTALVSALRTAGGPHRRPGEGGVGPGSAIGLALAMLEGTQREHAEQEAALREAPAAQTGSSSVAPEPLGHVSEELENTRDSREEQAAQKNVKPGQGGGGDGAGHAAM